MKKRIIKIVKQGTATPVAANQTVLMQDPEKQATNTVKNWVSERRTNDDVEKTWSGKQITAWNELPDISGKPA
jgi:hypothetical protein